MSCNVSYLNNTKLLLLCALNEKRQRLNKIREKEQSYKISALTELVWNTKSVGNHPFELLGGYGWVTGCEKYSALTVNLLKYITSRK